MTVGDLERIYDTLFGEAAASEYRGWLRSSQVFRLALVKKFMERLHEYRPGDNDVRVDLMYLLRLAERHVEDVSNELLRLVPVQCVSGFTVYQLAVSDEVVGLQVLFQAVEIGDPHLVDEGERLLLRAYDSIDARFASLPLQCLPG